MDTCFIHYHPLACLNKDKNCLDFTKFCCFSFKYKQSFLLDKISRIVKSGHFFDIILMVINTFNCTSRILNTFSRICVSLCYEPISRFNVLYIISISTIIFEVIIPTINILVIKTSQKQWPL